MAAKSSHQEEQPIARNEKKDEENNDNEKSELFANNLVEKVCNDIIAKFKLDPFVIGVGFKELYDLGEKRYEKIISQHCILLSKLLQVANDINIDININKYTKLLILQKIAKKIEFINDKINTADSLLDISEPFLTPIDDTFYIQSKLKEIAKQLSKSTLKTWIEDEHRRTMTRKKLIEENELGIIAMISVQRTGKYNFADMYQFLSIYRQICVKFNFMDENANINVNDENVAKNENYIKQCEKILEIACDVYNISDDNDDDDDDEEDDTENEDNNHNNNADDVDIVNNENKDSQNKVNTDNKSKEKETKTETETETEQEKKTDNGKENNSCSQKSQSKIKNDKIKCSDCVKLDKEYKITGSHVYYSTKLLENVYNGQVKWENDLRFWGSDYYSLDCGENALAFCAGTDYKFREPEIGCYLLLNNKFEQIHTSENMCKFKSPPTKCFVDDYHNICWYQSDDYIKGITMNCLNNNNTNNDNNDSNCEESNNNDNNQETDENSSESEYEDDSDDEIPDTSYNYKLIGNGRIISTKDQIISMSSNGKLSLWQCSNLFDDNINNNNVKPDITHNIKLLSEDPSKNNSFFWDNGVKISYTNDILLTNEILLSYNNALYFYDLNKQSVNNIYLTGRYSNRHNIPKRQHLYNINHSLIISYNWHCVKIFDKRINNNNNNVLSKISINGCGSSILNTVLGFNINGHNFIATGGDDEAITIWDLRYISNGNNGALYEISTGNCQVTELAWHNNSKKIFMIGECEYVDRLGNKYYGNGSFDVEDMDSDGEELMWPQNAKHSKTFFKDTYDAGMNSLFSYSFL